MRATRFEFRYRSSLNLLHFWLAFQVYVIDRVNVVDAFVPWAMGLTGLHARVLTRALFALGALLVGVGAAIRTWGAAYLRSEVVHDTKLHLETLVADGPYRHVRNPLYLGTFLWTLGLGFLASRLGFVILAGGAAIRILRLIGREEADLEEQQGEKFREYCRRVPRLLPAPAPRIPPGGIEPQWGQAFRGEAPIWCCLVAMIAFTVTLRAIVAWIGLGGAVAVWFVLQGSRMARRRRSGRS
ncbi:MAG TPA: isoprenylcysteine carboxylmethyltransferase family protein [Candidatus Polarisedimenticolia bacterium]|nr:isoprenylcysteine carboxylmethyltransferase family protein [Candidatus Polarisedimenticolia bacterium]